jgi:phosphotransferase system enzyme I (PtsI)
MASTRRLTGTIASRGLAEGPLVPLAATTVVARRANDARVETALIREAVARAVAEIGAIIEAADDEAAGMLEFQRAMLEDDALLEPVLAGIGQGQAAEVSWTHALDVQIGDYGAADDEYFRARSADLRDIRDRVLRALKGESDVATPPGAILSGDDIAPSQFLAVDWQGGGAIVLRSGSSASHVAMLARARGVPMLVGVDGLPPTGVGHVLVDAEEGAVDVAPDADSVASFRARREARRARRDQAEALLSRRAATSNGTPISVYINIARPADVDGVDVSSCDGVGLMRTEFLFDGVLPEEDTQLAAYRRVVRWAQGKPVTFRTVDAGGDKPIPRFTVAETNPFLGLRGIRLSLAHPEIFRVQIRALLRAAAEGNVSVMFPMVTIAAEFRAAASLFREEAVKLQEAQISHAMPRLGIMVEVPAVAIAPELLADAQFLSIGSNDLTQYVMAASRDNTAVAKLHDATHPAVLALIERVVRFAAGRGIPVSLCGDAGGDPAAIPSLLRAGLRSLSVSPGELAHAKLAIAGTAV